MVASNYVPRRLYSAIPRARTATGQRSFAINGPRTWNSLPADLRTPDRTPSSVISRPTCFSSSLSCCWQVGSAPFVRRRCDCLASSALFTNIQITYLLTPLSAFAPFGLAPTLWKMRGTPLSTSPRKSYAYFPPSLFLVSNSRGDWWVCKLTSENY